MLDCLNCKAVFFTSEHRSKYQYLQCFLIHPYTCSKKEALQGLFGRASCKHRHKKRKDSLESSLDQVLFAAEREFPKILAPRLPQNSLNVNIECVGK